MKTRLEVGAGSFQMVSEQMVQQYWEQFKRSVRWDPPLTDDRVYLEFLELANSRYIDMLCKWKKRYEEEKIVPRIDANVWKSFLDYWAWEDVKVKCEQCRKNRRSKLTRRGTGCSRHRGGARSVAKRARDYEIRTGQPASEWQLTLDLHGPHVLRGSYTYGKMANIIHEVEDEATQLSQQQSSTGDNDSDEPPEPIVVDMSQIYVKKVRKQKGRMVGLGNLGNTRRVGSRSSSLSYGVTSATQAKLDELQQYFEQQCIESRAREKQLQAELDQIKTLIEQLTRGGGA
ncbi:hypothetical protein ACS0TY_033267 [Phlomoides rotata]